MLILKSLSLSNFLSHSSTTIEFDENVKLNIAGNSGAGKSAVVEAILWVLFGRGRTDNRNMIKRGMKNATVVLEMADKDVLYRITRQVSEKGKQTLDIEKKTDILGWDLVSKIGLKDAQDYIEKDLLHSSYLLFINSVIYPQDNTESFVKQVASKRKELLLEIVGAESYDLYYTRAKSLASVTAESLNRLSAELTMLRQSRDEQYNSAVRLIDFQIKESQLKTEITELEAKQQIVTLRRTEFTEVSNNKLLVSNNYINKKTTVERMKKRKEDMYYSLNQEENPKYTEIEIEAKLVEQAEARKQIEEIQNMERAEANRKGKLMAIMANKPVEIDYGREIESLQKQMNSIASSTETFCPTINAVCPKLQGQIDSQTEYYRDQIEKKQTALEKLEASLISYTIELESVGPEIVYDAAKLQYLKEEIIRLERYAVEKARVAALSNMRAKQAVELESLETEIIMEEMELGDLFIKMEGVQNRLNTLSQEMGMTIDYSTEIRDKNTEFNNNAVQLSLAEKATEKVTELDAKIAEKAEKQHAETEKFEELTLVKEAFGSTGIKSVVIDYILPGLEEKINEILSKLSDFKITLDTQRASVTGEKAIEGLFIEIFNPQGERFDYDSYSGGQKNRIAYAIFEGLASIQKCNFRIFDESIAGLDSETINSFAEVLLQMNQEEKQILCVSHIQQIQDLFSERLEVVNTDGNSKII